MPVKALFHFISKLLRLPQEPQQILALKCPLLVTMSKILLLKFTSSALQFSKTETPAATAISLSKKSSLCLLIPKPPKSRSDFKDSPLGDVTQSLFMNATSCSFKFTPISLVRKFQLSILMYSPHTL